MKTRIVTVCMLLLPFLSKAQIYLGDNGLTVSGTSTNKKVQLGGSLVQSTDVDLSTSFNFNFKKSSTSYFYIQNNGNIGVNTSSPSFKFDVNGTSRFKSTMKIDFGTTNQFTEIKDDGLYFTRPSGSNAAIRNVNSFIQYEAGSSHRFFVNVGEAMTIDDNMYVGINKNPPSAQLHVFSTGNTGSTSAFYVQNSSSLDLLKIKDDKTIEFQGTSAVLNSSGNFGLGTASPTAQLHNTGTVRFAGLSNNNSAPRVLASDSLGNVSWRAVTTINNSNWSLSGNNLINSNSGYVGINTTANPDPSNTNLKFAVNGHIYATKIKVTQSGWADYVFESNYDLPSLAYVEQYVRDHKHLPDVPSAAEVEKNGTDLGDTQVILLKKIEELTLYVIQQQKEINELRELLKKK